MGMAMVASPGNNLNNNRANANTWGFFGTLFELKAQSIKLEAITALTKLGDSLGV